MNSYRSTRYEEMSGEGKTRGRRSGRVAAQQNESGKEGIPAKKEMTVEELKRYGFVYFEDGRWKRDVLLWRDCCGSAVEYEDGTSAICLAAKKTGRGKVIVEDADDGADIAAYVCGKKAHRKYVRTWVTPYVMTETSADDTLKEWDASGPASQGRIGELKTRSLADQYELVRPHAYRGKESSGWPTWEDWEGVEAMEEEWEDLVPYSIERLAVANATPEALARHKAAPTERR